MYRSPWELEAQIRYKTAHLVDERRRCSRIDRAATRSRGGLTGLRRRVGVGLIQVGAAVAGRDALRGRAAPQPWPDLACR